ncbi:hypothetical protein [Nocardioides sp.]|uniref:hypothetical protein n=1 Tax=Nocardioides sp. TaxID=35761 RepID=UPI003D12E4CA
MSSTSKAERLRNRLSINPDEPAPATLMSPPPVAPPPVAPQPAQQPAPAAPAENQRAQEEAQPAAAATPPSSTPTRPPAAARKTRRPRLSSPEVLNAVQDPSITPGRKDYRSFYIEDESFARFRAAIYWLARREDAADVVPENMSVAVETWMAETSAELERRFNGGEIFRMPPPPKRRRTQR